MLVIEVEKLGEWIINDSYTDYVAKRLEDTFSSIMANLEANEQQSNNKGAGFFEKIYDNLYLSVASIDFRIDVQGKDRTQNFAFGGYLKGVEMLTIDENGERTFLLRKQKTEQVQKQLKFDDLKLYYDNQVLEDEKDYDDYLVTKEMSEIFSISMDIFLEINPFDNEKSAQNKLPVYALKTQINAIKINLEKKALMSFKNLSEILRLHNMTYLKYELNLEKNIYLLVTQTNRSIGSSSQELLSVKPKLQKRRKCWLRLGSGSQSKPPCYKKSPRGWVSTNF